MNKTFKDYQKIISLPLIFFISSILITISFVKSAPIYLFFLVVFFGFSLFFLKNRILVTLLIFILITFHFINLKHVEKNHKRSINIIYNIESFTGHIQGGIRIKNQKYQAVFTVKSVKFKSTSVYREIVPFKIMLKWKEPIDICDGEWILIKKTVYLPMKEINTFHYREYLSNNGIYGISNIKRQDISKLNLPNKINPVIRKIHKLREFMLTRLKSGLNSRVYGFICSIFFGLRSILDDDINKEFQNTGMVHILAISGFHLVFISSAIMNVFLIFLSRIKSVVITMIFLSIYMIMLVPSASSSRSYLMFIIQSIFFIYSFKTSSISILSLSGIILSFINPYVIYDIGFQFSFLATSGIILLNKKIISYLPEWIPKIIKENISISLSASFAVTFVQISIFGKFPYMSIITSIITVPLFGYLFGILSVLIIITMFIKLSVLFYLMTLFTEIYLKIIHILNNIKSAEVHTIPMWCAYLILIATFIIIFFIIPLFRKIYRSYQIKNASY